MLCLLYGGWRSMNTRYTARASGVVSEVLESMVQTAPNQPTVYSSTVAALYTYNGRDYGGQLIVRGSMPFAVGDRIEVYIDPNNPQQPKLTSSGQWLTPVLMFGGLFVGGMAFARIASLPNDDVSRW
jgi:hypothetical protein